jgi:hypothetical protein
VTTVPLTSGGAPPHRPKVPLPPTGTALQVSVGLRTTSPLTRVAAVFAAPAVAAMANEPAAPKFTGLGATAATGPVRNDQVKAHGGTGAFGVKTTV